MTYIKSFEEFVNESKLIKTETITHEIEYDIDRQFVSEGGFKSEEDMADTIANDVNLKSGGRGGHGHGQVPARRHPDHVGRWHTETHRRPGWAAA
jgi:hypothetical protein